MVWTSQLLRVVDEPRRAVRCRDCRRRIQWATTNKGKKVPLNAGELFVYREERIGHVRYAVIGAIEVHHCRVRRAWVGGGR